jgi:hypothetical protein
MELLSVAMPRTKRSTSRFLQKMHLEGMTILSFQNSLLYSPFIRL